MNKDTFCFICGSFKPMNENHRKMIDYYSTKCNYVFVIISNPKKSIRKGKNGNYITAEQAKEIADYVIQDSKWNNVKVKVSKCNPIKTMMEYMSKLKNCDVIIGCGKKDNDYKTYDYLIKNFKNDKNVNILPIEDNAFEIQDGSDNFSSTEIRNNIENTNFVKKCLPSTLTSQHVNKIMEILQENTDFIASLEENKNDKYNSNIFQELMEDNEYDQLFEAVDNEMQEMEEDKLLEQLFVSDDDEMINEDEQFRINLDNNSINNAECGIIAYGMHVDENENVDAYNPKNNPDKAIDIVLNFNDQNIKLEIFLDTKTLSWDSWINEKEGKLSPNQMEQFFNSELYHKIYNRLTNVWPKKDIQFEKLLEAITNKKYRIDFSEESNNEELQEDDNDEEYNGIETRTHNVKLGDPNEKNTSGKKIRSSSGRKLINFTDQGVAKGNEKYYSWPGGTDDKHIFKWSRWNDWEKQKPFVRCRFAYNVGQAKDIIGCSLNLLKEDDINRGFICYDLSLIPRLQYLTPEETTKILNLSIVRRFIKVAYKRIKSILEYDDEEIYRRINKPEKCTLDDIRKTKSVIRNTLKILREPRANTFIYT